MLTILAVCAQASAVYALLVRKGWRTVRVLFWVEMVQAGMMMAFYALPHDSTLLFHLWHYDNQLSFLLYLFVFVAYVFEEGCLLYLALLSSAEVLLILAMYVDLMGDSTLVPAGPIYYGRLYLAILIDAFAAFSVYTRSVGKPHREDACQNRNTSQSPNPPSRIPTTD